VSPLAVDPEALFAAGSAVVAAGDGLAANLTVLTSGFSAHTGLDAAGTVFGLAYQDTAESLLQAATAAINACRHSGALIEQGASNYSKAEAASTLGGGAGVLEGPAQPVTIAAPGPPGTLGPGKPPPLLWALVQSFLDDVWPDGDAAGMHAAAARWRSFGAAASGMQGALNASKTLLDGQQILEGGKIDDALSQMGTAVANIGEQCGKLATSLDGFADEVEQAQNTIRDLLHRLESLTNLAHDVMVILEGDAIEEIKKVAEDIEGVLHNLGREARAFEQGVKGGLGVVDALVVKLEKYVRGQLTHFLGDAVGNQVATVFDVFANANEGVLKGAVGMALAVGDLDPGWIPRARRPPGRTWAKACGREV
jgi:archaellum component FlaC